ncbi:hypothetical protein E2605_18650 [Dysgonomonas capnocytophagoides]|uniref:Uncharacterized protein n=1 Tax=Dysgonomonas capnocytophagoides TaxID=45254 RepID=A0A4Y8KV00_9BACT|nr:hypothetical protein [Dysgonomonas capnocytophagoides]TFD92580.1 hypothetical protein E2605_18650 [Dysgonomonas capnocytophagoides]
MNDILDKLRTTYPDWNTFISRQGAENLVQIYYEFTTIKAIVSSRRVTIGDLEKVYPFKDTKAGILYFKDWIEYLNKYTHLKKLPTELIPNLTFQLYMKYKHFTLPDLRLCMERLLENFYDKTKFYGSVDVQSILTLFRLYNEDRISILSKLKIERDENIKNTTNFKLSEIRGEEYDKLKNEKYEGNLFDEAARRAEIRISNMFPELAV